MWRPGNGQIPSKKRSILTRPSAITDDSSPSWGTKVAIFLGCCLRSGFALPSPAASENFLILIVGDSYRDCRVAQLPVIEKLRYLGAGCV